MKTIILIRRWKNYKPWMEISKKIDLWNSLFKIPFIEFRHELSKIAFDNHEIINPDKIYYYLDDFDFTYYTNKKDYWIIPIDDDDWLSNNVCTYLKDTYIEQDVICWKCNVLTTIVFDGKIIPASYIRESSIDYTQEVKNRTTNGYCDSCCYAVKNEKITKSYLCNHAEISKTINREYSDKVESLYLALAQSTWRLHHNISSAEDLINHIEQVKNLQENQYVLKEEFANKLNKIKSLFASLL